MSNIGNPCLRRLWYDKYKPEGQEKLSASTKFKFLFGDLIEEIILFIAEVSGHEVKDRQKKRKVAGIHGSSDVTIDGHLVDVKSASSYSFKKFQKGLTIEEDAFGYRAQLKGYHTDAQKDDNVLDKDKASFLVVDKQNGNITLDTHVFDHDGTLEEEFERRKEILGNPDKIPDRGFEPEADGYKKDGEFKPNGSFKLGINCSYCSQKFNCYPNLRTFVTSAGKPVFYTEVKHKPRMFELTKEEYLKEDIHEENPA